MTARTPLLLPLVLALAAAAAGCGGDDAGSSDGCARTPLAAGSHSFALEHGGRTRYYNLYVPASAAAGPLPLVVNFHGFTSDATQEELFADMDATAEAHGFLVAYPEGIDSSWNAGACCGTAVAEQVDDVGFVRALVADIERQTCVAPGRVYATGMSNGGFLAHRLACEAADLFAAFAPVAGYLVMPAAECTPARPVPLIHFHGTADPAVPYAGDTAWPGAVASLEDWAARDGCRAGPSETYRNGAAHCDTWSDCDGGVEVTLCTIDGMGHCWPGSTPATTICNATASLGPGSMDISANEQMWALFERFPGP